MGRQVIKTWMEYDCPTDGIDYDIEPCPPYKSLIATCWCGVHHIADETIANAHSLVRNENGTEQVLTLNDDWKAGKFP